MKKILLTATVQSHICQFHIPLISLLHELGCEVHVAARNNLKEKNGLSLECADKIFDVPFSRSPFSKNNIKALKMLKKIISDDGYEINHCNTPMGGVLTRLAAKKARKKGTKVLYTAHGFHFYKGSPFKNWLLYYPVEKMLSRITDGLITIVGEDYYLANKKFHCPVYHTFGVGVKTEKFKSFSALEAQKFREEQNWSDKIVLLCTGELNKNKNQIALINALPHVLVKNPNVILLLAGNGPERSNLIKAISEQGLDKNAFLLGYRTDLEKYVWSSDIVISLSKREGLPVNILEAMYCEKPVIASNNRGHRELISNGINGILLEKTNSSSVCDAISKLVTEKDSTEKYVFASLKKVQLYLDFNVKEQLRDIYKDFLK